MITTKTSYIDGYKTWRGMIYRCHYNSPANKDYPRYGGRGIKVCKRWQGKNGFQNFLKDMGKRPSKKHSIDRIDNNGNYEPNNCRWADILVQNRNKGVCKGLHQQRLAELTGFSQGRLSLIRKSGVMDEHILKITKHGQRYFYLFKPTAIEFLKQRKIRTDRFINTKLKNFSIT